MNVEGKVCITGLLATMLSEQIVLNRQCGSIVICTSQGKRTVPSSKRLTSSSGEVKALLAFAPFCLWGTFLAGCPAGYSQWGPVRVGAETTAAELLEASSSDAPAPQEPVFPEQTSAQSSAGTARNNKNVLKGYLR